MKAGRKKISIQQRHSTAMLAVFACLLLTSIYFIASSKVAHSQCMDECDYVYFTVDTQNCSPFECMSVPITYSTQHSTCLNGGSMNGCSGKGILQHISDEFDEHESWLEDTYKNIFIPAMKAMALQLNAVTMQQTLIIGMFFDAKESLETQRTIQELQVQAHEDYQPSESFCTFGTAVRSIAHTESAGRTAQKAMSRRQMSRHLGVKGAGGSENKEEDKRNRWQHFLKAYCDPQDNNWVEGETDTGLTSVCDPTITRDPNRTNIDIDYTRLIENRKTLDIYGGAWYGVADELDIAALGNNLYGHDILSRNINQTNIASDELAGLYLDMRTIAAKRGVAENSFNAIVGLKSQGSTYLNGGTTSANKYLGKILQDLGIPEDEVVKYLGLDPDLAYIGQDGADTSYLATMEILAKKIYQNPTFYANLYDTPANVQRKSAALKAFDLMLDRSIYESQLRREMAMSVLLSSRIQTHQSERPSTMWGE